MKSTHQLIANRISRLTTGDLVFPTDFRGLGSEDSIKMSLSRHAKENNLERLGHGIYLKVGKSFKAPELEIVANAIAKKEKVKIRPAGDFALYQLGLNKSKPNDLVYLTNGEPRNIKIGSQRLIFKSTTCKKLALSQGTSGLLVLALDELGKDRVTEQLTQQICEKIIGIDQKIWLLDLLLAPGWIYNLLFKLHQKTTT